MADIPLSPLLKVAVRLIDLHDSRRGLGESPQYQSEDRTGLSDGRYIAIAEEVLCALQDNGVRSGDQFASLAAIQQDVQARIPWASVVDVEYVLNVLARPTEIKLLHKDGDEPEHVIGDKETNLVDKAAHIGEYRLSKVGKTALAIATDNNDITYIEGDVTKLIRAIEAGRLKAALGFVDRLLIQLRAELLALGADIEQSAGRRKTRTGAIENLELHRQIQRRTVDLTHEAEVKIQELIRKEKAIDEDVPIGLIRAKVKELMAGVVRYGRDLARLAELSIQAGTSTVSAPSFLGLAQRWVRNPPSESQISVVTACLGPASSYGTTPIGTDLSGTLKPRSAKQLDMQIIEMDGYAPAIEDQFIEWMRANQETLRHLFANGELSLEHALRICLGDMSSEATLSCLVTAMTAPDEWLTDLAAQGLLHTELSHSTLPGLQVMHSKLQLQMSKQEVQNDAL